MEVINDVTAHGRPDVRLEQIVSRLGIETGVVAVSWKVVPTNDDERELVAEA